MNSENKLKRIRKPVKMEQDVIHISLGNKHKLLLEAQAKTNYQSLSALCRMVLEKYAEGLEKSCPAK